MKITAIGADISRNDVSCSNTLVENIESDLYKLKALGARDAALTNVTGDDVVISAFVEDDLLENVNMTDVSDLIEPKSKKIPGVGYVSPETDDPVIVATVENIESVGVIAGAMIGAALGNKNVYLVKRGTNCNVLPGSVIFSATAFMNGNVIDLAVPFENKTRILR